jgi:hypothetical protein
METADLNWSAKLLYDHTKSEITQLSVPAFTYGVGGQGLGGVFYAREGEKIGTFYGVQAAADCSHLPAGMGCDEFAMDDEGFLVWLGAGGSFDTPDWGGEGPTVGGKIINWGTPFAGYCTDTSTGEETLFCNIGNTIPNYNVGISTSLNWKGVSLYGLLSHSADFDVYNQPLQWGTFKRFTGIYDQTGVNQAEQKPIGYYDAWYAVSGLAPSSVFVEDASFTKIREISLSYRITPDMLGNVPILGSFNSIGLNLSGRNLWTWSDYRGYDPENGETGGDTGSAAIARVDGYNYPNFRTFAAAIEFIF